MNAEEMFDGEVIRAKYIVDHYIESGITTWIYIPEEKKEIKMSETNLQHYKEELKKIFNEDYEYPSVIHDKIRMKIDVSVESDNYTKSLTDDILDWMAQPYKEPILDDAERKYLADVIRPFRNKIDTILKFQTWDGSSQYIYISMKDNHMGTLPVFPKGTMYKGMENGKHYSLKELGL